MRTVQTIILLATLVEASAALQAQTQPNAPQDNAPAKMQTPTKGKDVAAKTKAAKAAAKQKAAPAGDQDASAPKPAPVKSKLEPDKSVSVEAGYADWGLTGNQSKFRQYATPPTGFFLGDLRYAPALKSPSESALFELRGIGQDDYLAAGRGAWDYGATQASGFLRQSRFFDPTVGTIDPSTWRTEGLNLRQAVTRDFALTFQARSDSQQLNFATPYPSLNQNTDFWDAVAGGKLGQGYARLSFSNFHYADSTQTLVNFDAQTTALKYLWTPSSTVGIEAAGSHVNIRQPDLAQSVVDTLSLGGDIALGPSTDLSMAVQHRQLGLPNVQNAYVHNENSGVATLSQRWNSWRAQIGLRLQNDDRVTGDQSYVDVPKWSTLEGRLSGRLFHNWKLSLRGYTQNLSDPPASVLDDTATLYWTSINFFQAKLETGTPDINGYLIYTYRVERNSQRDTDVTTGQYTVGGTWQVNPRVNLFAEYHHENWTGRTDTDVYPALNNFLPDSDTGVVELNWYLGRRANVSVNYTGFATYNDNPLLLQDGNTRASFVTINTHYRFPAGYELGLLVAPWTYRDNVVNALNYNATVLMVTGSARF